MAKRISWYTEKGNVSVKMRDLVREQVKSKFAEGIVGVFENAVPNKDGGISVPVAENERGETIYAHFNFTVSVKSPDMKTERKKAEKKETDSEPMVSLFD